MRWWYFHRTNAGLELATQDEFGIRPPDALPSNGDPHTPYYMTYDHIDEDHIHLKAKDLEEAILKAMELLITFE